MFSKCNAELNMLKFKSYVSNLYEYAIIICIISFFLMQDMNENAK